MYILKITIVALALSGLSACLKTDGERALAGAAAGAIISDTFGGNVAVGAVAGAAAGALCDELRLCN